MASITCVQKRIYAHSRSVNRSSTALLIIYTSDGVGNIIMDNSKKIILDLCGGTGSWAKPYKDAGYDVITITLPEYSVLNTTIREKTITFWGQNGNSEIHVNIDEVYGILAAPPCTMFSMARTRAKTPRDMRGGFQPVRACLEIIWACQYDGNRLAFWALENPKARLRWFLGKPHFTFNPYDFGDRHRKPTDIWGYFEDPKKTPVQLTTEELQRMGNNSRRLPILPGISKGDRQARRSITPPGFAQAFYKANK